MNSKDKQSQELNQVNDEKKIKRDFKGIWIPKEIWLFEGLTIAEKALWAEIDSLYDEEKGGCYASNEYLCKFNGVKLRVLQRMIANLKAKGLIEQVAFDGRERIIKAVVPQRVSYQTCQICHGRDEENDTHIIKNINKEISSSEDIKKVTRATFVSTTNSEHKKLEEKYGKEKREWCYNRLSEWKQDKPKQQWSKCDYRTILRWVSDAYHEEQLKIKKREGFDARAKNIAMASKITTNFKSLAEQKGIQIKTNMMAISFVFLKDNKEPIVIEYSNKAFKEQVDNIMRKLRLI